MTRLKAVTNTSIEFSRGVLKPGDSVASFSFSPGQPLVGLQGYESPQMIKALGFIKFNCSEWRPSKEDRSVLITEWRDEQTGIIVWSLAGVVIMMTIVGLLAVGAFVWYRRKQKKLKRFRQVMSYSMDTSASKHGFDLDSELDTRKEVISESMQKSEL